MKGFWARFKFLLVMLGAGLGYILFKMWSRPKKTSAGVSDDIEVEIKPTATVVKKIDMRKEKKPDSK